MKNRIFNKAPSLDYIPSHRELCCIGSNLRCSLVMANVNCKKKHTSHFPVPGWPATTTSWHELTTFICKFESNPAHSVGAGFRLQVLIKKSRLRFWPPGIFSCSPPSPLPPVRSYQGEDKRIDSPEQDSPPPFFIAIVLPSIGQWDEIIL